jgi:2-polyprenyl-6-methoxyphenol hydroxylase-like FAD-dependent oxidoreductase
VKAVVVGGGIGGLASAIALRQVGWDVEVFEQAPEIGEVGAGIALWVNGLRALDALGVGSAVRAAGAPDFGTTIRTSAGEVLNTLGAGGDLVGIGLHRAELLDILLDEYGEVRTDRRCTGVRLARAGAVVSFGDEDVTADLVVGADGISSTVRAAFHGHEPPRPSGITAWRAVLDFDAGELLPGESWGDGRTFGRLPLPNGRAYVFGAARGAGAVTGRRAALLRLFGDWHDPIPRLVEQLGEEQILRNEICDRPPLRRWSRGCVTLLGDAAHPMLPVLGQGACQALEDAVVLARTVPPGSDVPEDLEAYERQRRRRANRCVRESRLLAQVMFGSSRLRDLGMRHTPAWLQQLTLSHLLG